MLDVTNLAKVKELAKLMLSQRVHWGIFGGGGQSRTVDAADMSRVL